MLQIGALNLVTKACVDGMSRYVACFIVIILVLLSLCRVLTLWPYNDSLQVPKPRNPGTLQGAYQVRYTYFVATVCVLKKWMSLWFIAHENLHDD